MDVGAAAGGFTKRLLAAGARRVYAVDAGHGQLVGELRQDKRVVNLEATNLGVLDTRRVPEPVGIITIDVSYLALSDAVPQLEAVAIEPDAELLALVKPQFELHAGVMPAPDQLDEAVQQASTAIEESGWRVGACFESAVRGSRGAIEFWIHAKRQRNARTERLQRRRERGERGRRRKR